jgi:hypothetical protein
MKIDKMSDRELRVALKSSLTVVKDLMDSHEELLAGVGGIVCDIGLLNTCRIAGDKHMRDYE